MRFLRLLVAALVAWLGFAPAVAASPLPDSTVAAYTYDASGHVSPPIRAATERGPPTAGDRNGIYNAADRLSRGASARPDGPTPRAATTYNDAVRIVQGAQAQATGTTKGQARAADGGLSRFSASSVAANSGNRVFWSGGDVAKNAAADYARANGGKTLEMTLTGRALEKIPYNRFTKPVTGKLWDAASWRFARSARGDAHVFFGPNAPRPGSVFARIEGPILDRRGNTILQHFLE